MMWARIDGNEVVEAIETARDLTVTTHRAIDGIEHEFVTKIPASALASWPLADLATYGIVPARTEGAAPSPHHVNTGTTWAVVDGEAVGTLVYDLPTFDADALKAYAGNVRWRREVGGCDWNGHTVQTDRDSQSKLIAEFVAIGAGLRTDPSPWKFAGGFAVVSNADMGAVIMAARTHIAQCFALEQTVIAAIDAGTVTTRAQIDSAFA